MIKNIYLHKIKPHPNNPRYDLGDLDDLVLSIKAQGVMQNLTVVPYESLAYQDNPETYDGNYVTIIGHRRKEAAKIAGLNTVPCSVVLLSERDQIAAMLAENLQRTDLTLAEQGQGFQMMLDLGEDFKGISKKTGISEKTIKKKVRIVNAIGIAELMKVRDRSVTLEDYERLMKITCQYKRGEALEKIGTRDFDWCVETALRAQEKEADRLSFMHRLAAFSKPATRDETQGSDVQGFWAFSKFDELDKEKLDEAYVAADEDTEFIHFYCDKQESVLLCLKSKPAEVNPVENRPVEAFGAMLYTQSPEDYKIFDAVRKGLFPDDPEYAKPQGEIEVRTSRIDERASEKTELYKTVLANEDAKARKDKLRTKFAQAREMRMSFAKKYRVTKETSNALDTMVLFASLHHEIQSAQVLTEVFGDMGWEKYAFEDREKSIGKLVKTYSKGRSSLLFLAAYSKLECPKDFATATGDYATDYRKNAKLSRLYEYLGALGYIASEEEEQLFNGTHPLYTGVKQ